MLVSRSSSHRAEETRNPAAETDEPRQRLRREPPDLIAEGREIAHELEQAANSLCCAARRAVAPSHPGGGRQHLERGCDLAAAPLLERREQQVPGLAGGADQPGRRPAR